MEKKVCESEEIISLRLECDLDLSKVVFRDEKIVGLSLEGLGLKTLPESVEKFTDLEYLNLRNNELTIFPESIFELKKLKRLNFENNNLRTIPKEIGDLVKLEYLNFSHNEIVKIYSRITQLPELKVLLLEDNKIDTIEFSFQKLVKLKTLNLKGNSIKIVPNGLNFVRLDYLDLSCNKIKEIPVEIFGDPLLLIHNLKYLIVYGNPLKEVPSIINTSDVLKELCINKDTGYPERLKHLVVWVYPKKKE